MTYSFSDIVSRYDGRTTISDLEKAIEFACYVIDPRLENWVGEPPNADLLNLATQFLAMVKTASAALEFMGVRESK